MNPEQFKKQQAAARKLTDEEKAELEIRNAALKEKLIHINELTATIFAHPAKDLTIGELWFVNNQTWAPKEPAAPSLDERVAELERILNKLKGSKR